MIENSENEMQASILGIFFSDLQKSLAKLLVIEAGVCFGGGEGTGLERKAGRYIRVIQNFICQGYIYLKMMIFFLQLVHLDLSLNIRNMQLTELTFQEKKQCDYYK